MGLPLALAFRGEAGHKGRVLSLLGASRMPVVGLTVVLAGVLLATNAQADEPTRASIEYKPSVYPESGARMQLLGVGAGAFAGGYALAWGTSLIWSDSPTSVSLRYPVVGPVLAIAKLGCDRSKENTYECGTGTVVVRSVLAGVSGLFQLGGIALMLESLFLPTSSKSSVSRTANSSESLAPNQGRIHPTVTYAAPAAVGNSVGLVVGGRF
jgi:hypothetical protein